MIELLARLEATRMSVWLRESTSVMAYPAILSAHAIGMGLAAGINLAIALRLLGAGRAIPPAELRRFVPVMWFGFWLNAASGVALLIAYPTKALTNPVFYLKLSLIAVALGIFTLIRRQVFEASQKRGPSLRFLAAASLLSWAGAITSGRLLAYTYTRLFATW